MLAEGRRKAAEVLARHSSKVDKFLEIAYRKVSAPDEYGDEKPKALDEEIRRFLRKLAETELELRNRLVASRYGSPEGVVARSSC
jgi:hypothetical protein